MKNLLNDPDLRVPNQIKIIIISFLNIVTIVMAGIMSWGLNEFKQIYGLPLGLVN